MNPDRAVRAPRGSQISARSWLTEAPLRMLMNNLDPEVAERPEDLVVYGGIGKAARTWECFDAIVASLKVLENDQSLLVQSGKPVGVFRTHADAPRVLIANSNLVPHWANWEHFNELDRKGLMMYGQMTAGSWIYIGSQGIVQGTYETFAEAGRQHYGGDWSGQMDPHCRPGRDGRRAAARRDHGRRLDAGDRMRPDAHRDAPQVGLSGQARLDLDEALHDPRRRSEGPVSVGLLGNAAELLPQVLQKAKDTQFRPSLVTDQTSAHDPANGYLPEHWSLQKWQDLRKREPDEVALSARESIANHVQAILQLQGDGHSVC